MTTQEHLLTILAEECAEVAQRASKALRFGLTEVQSGQALTNAERIMEELDDLKAIVQMLQAKGCLGHGSSQRVETKKSNVEKWLAYSSACGTRDKIGS